MYSYTIEATIKTVVVIEAASHHEARDGVEDSAKFLMSQWLINPDREKYDVEITRVHEDITKEGE
jgi:hypothetical protein